MTDRNTIGLVTDLVATPWLVKGLETIHSVVGLNKIAAIEGDPGTGKTTTVRVFREQCDRPVALATMPGRPAPLDLLRLIYQALNGVPPSGRVNKFGLQNELLEQLRDWGGVLIVDELQNSAVRSMQDLVWLYEESQHAFAVVVVGSNVLDAMHAYPQLLSRVMGSVTFAPLTGEVLIETVRGLDSRLDRTDVGALLVHDANACRGVLRRWIMTIEWLNMLDVPDETAVDEDTLSEITRRMPLWK